MPRRSAAWWRRSALLASAGMLACREPASPDTGLRLLSFQVGPRTVPCVGAFPMDCLLVREPGDLDWQYLFDAIEGFTYEPGFTYTLLVALRSVPNPPMDGSSVAYQLVSVLAKVPE